MEKILLTLLTVLVYSGQGECILRTTMEEINSNGIINTGDHQCSVDIEEVPNKKFVEPQILRGSRVMLEVAHLKLPVAYDNPNNVRKVCSSDEIMC